MLGHSDTGRHINVAIVYVSITCLSPFFALAILSTDKVVRDDGVYIISPKTTLWIEAKELVKIFTNKYMLLFIPYMFSYRFLEGFDIDYTEDLSMMVAHDFGKLFMILMGQLLDVQWATRRTRGLASLLLLTSILIIHYSLSTYLRLNSYDLSKLSSSMSLEEINAFYSQESNRRVHRILVCSYFFGGVSSGFTRLFGFWVMGTFTNDFKSSARFIGTYQCIKTFAVFMGTELSTHIATKKRYADILYLAALSMFAVALVLAYFVVRHITETNDWSFANISSYGNSNDIMLEDLASKAQVVDVKYQHVGRS
ncbi:hypothetical protein GGI07_001128 [Coemansia sp. Benny D115]|nr:hypothetical protein GGI07_001128 [Coemansia sp. Benny D115]